MNTYNIFINRTYKGSIKTDDIEGFIKTNYYPEIIYFIDEQEKDVFLTVDIIKAIKFAERIGN